MDERRHRCRALHGVGEPHVERQLRGLAARAEEEQEHDRRRGAGRQQAGVGAALRRSRGSRTRRRCRNMAMRKPKSPMRLVTKAFLPAAAARLPLEPERDQQVGAGADALPAEEREQEVVGQHEHQHREGEQVEVDEEPRVPRVAVHVADRIQVDQRAHAGDEQRHGDRQRVDEEAALTSIRPTWIHVNSVSVTLRSSVRQLLEADEGDDGGRERAAPSRAWRSSPRRGRRARRPSDEQRDEAGERERGDQPGGVEHQSPSP